MFLSSLFFTNSQAVILKSNLNYDVQSIDLSKKLSRKILIHVQDLDYKWNVQAQKHIVYGFIEFDVAYLMKFMDLTNNFRYIHVDDITEIISNQLDQTRLTINLRQKFFEKIIHDFVVWC